MTNKTRSFTPGDGPFRFKVKLEGDGKTQVAALRPPFDVPTVFGTKARVPVRGTINGAPFRSSLCNMGGGHFMVVNRELREAGNCAAGDTVDVVIERDTQPRTVAVPPFLKKIIDADPKAQKTWDSYSYTHKKEWVNAIAGAKKEETKQKRVDQIMKALKAGKRVGF